LPFLELFDLPLQEKPKCRRYSICRYPQLVLYAPPQMCQSPQPASDTSPLGKMRADKAIAASLR
jgi:hypothetical protein